MLRRSRYRTLCLQDGLRSRPLTAARCWTAIDGTLLRVFNSTAALPVLTVACCDRLFARVAASLRIGGTFLIADRTDALGLYGHMRLLEESGFEEIDCAWRQNHSFVCGGTKVG